MIQLLLALGDPCRYYLILRNTWDYDRGAFHLYGLAWDDRRLELTHTAFDAGFDAPGHVLDRALRTELRTKMVDDFLLNEDRTSMASGLEVRVPFLDRDLVRFATGIPDARDSPGARRVQRGGAPDQGLRHDRSTPSGGRRDGRAPLR